MPGGLILACALLLAAVHPAASAVPAAMLQLNVAEDGVTGQLKVDVRAVGALLALDANGDGRITWLEIEPHRDEISSVLAERVSLHGDAARLDVRLDALVFGQQDGRDLLRADIAAAASAPVDALVVECGLGAPVGDIAGCQVDVYWPDGRLATAELATDAPERVFARDDARSGALFMRFLTSGIWHIWIGFDHVLFLLALLIPAVYRGGARRFEPEPRLLPSLTRVAATVTAFTLTHSLTLTCAAMGWLRLPGDVVEPAIAASVFVAAAHNIRPWFARHSGTASVALAAAFGLLHGFGFAGVLADEPIDGGSAWTALLSFNLGVEIGQLAIVAVFFPLSFLARRTEFYRFGVVYGGSAAVCLCALTWFFQRVLSTGSMT